MPLLDFFFKKSRYIFIKNCVWIETSLKKGTIEQNI